MKTTGQEPGPDRPSKHLGRSPTSEAFAEVLIQEVREVRTRAETLFGELNRKALDWSPEPGRWGVGACIEHLVRTNALYFPRIREGLDALEPRGRSPENRARGGAFGRWFASMAGPEPRMRLPAPKAFRPPVEEIGSSSSLDNLVRQQDELADLLNRAKGLPLDDFKLRSPVSPLIRLRLTDAFRLTVGHEWRHLDQARQVLEHPAFPDRGAP